MPKSPFSGPYKQVYKPTASLPGTVHAFNGEEYEAGAEPSSEGTQLDALGHFAYLAQPWDGKLPVPVDQARYYGGYGQRDVKPTPDSPLLKLGVDRVPPLAGAERRAFDALELGRALVGGSRAGHR